MIEVHDLTVTYDGRDVLHKVTLTVPDGAHIALMGPVTRSSRNSSLP